jgi:O-acetyl-ADP-ribose deacetylase (regulator of RNase III)
MEQEIAGLADKLAAMESCSILVTRFEEDADKYTGSHVVEAVQGDITRLAVDAIVNVANKRLGGVGGISGAVFDAAGYDDMTAACSRSGSCDYGGAVITPGFKLPAQHVIHTVGPIYGQHSGQELDILYSCYQQSLRLAQEQGLRTVAFPLILTGIYGYPKAEAAHMAVTAIREFYKDNPRTPIERIILCAYANEDMALLRQALDN